MQVSIYLRLIDMTGKPLNTGDSGNENLHTLFNNLIDLSKTQFMKIVNYQNDVAQTLNIGSQSTGAGAGKITFNPFVITKYLDAASPMLFQNATSGMAYQTAEVFFTNSQNVVVAKQTYKMVSTKTVAWSAADSNNAGVLETVSFEYGSQVITVYPFADGTTSLPKQAGWNAIKNIIDDQPNA